MNKKEIRRQFREVCLKRDKYSCVMCGFKSSPEKSLELDVHHIQDRHLLDNGGYVMENGISLCSGCHLKAEEYHCYGLAHLGYSMEDLYLKIGSSLEEAVKASKYLK